jgi:surface carbohydrate biosynthesis protein
MHKNYEVKKVALIVDNPLRDLDGLVLVAFHLAQINIEAWLVPMYDQMFDISAIGADLVLLNYIRPNNANHVLDYLRKGIRVVVLDTEGVTGQSAEEFAKVVSTTNLLGLVDLYCVWGNAQKKSLELFNPTLSKNIIVTGCPRYDFCIAPWIKYLPSNNLVPGYILINTTFATINPKFSSGSTDEAKAMIDIGFSSKFSNQYNADAQIALIGMMDLISELTISFPDKQFVLRPHPFESCDLYIKKFSEVKNLTVRQEGTSIQWIKDASILIHLNCTTAIEAHMMGKLALSPKWLDTKTLHLNEPASVSIQLNDANDFLKYLLRSHINKKIHSKILSISNLYGKMDGKSSERLAKSIENVLESTAPRRYFQQTSLKTFLVRVIRLLIGYRASKFMLKIFGNREMIKNRSYKYANIIYVKNLVNRLASTIDTNKKVSVDEMREVKLSKPLLASGKSIRITLERVAK